jgi:two-component system, sensor histidine kinase and response regulator
MPQIVILERAVAQRHALEYVLTDAQYSVMSTDDPSVITHSVSDPALRCVIVGDADFERIAEHRAALQIQRTPLIALIAAGDFSAILRALELQADLVLSRELPASELVIAIDRLLRGATATGVHGNRPSPSTEATSLQEFLTSTTALSLADSRAADDRGSARPAVNTSRTDAHAADDPTHRPVMFGHGQPSAMAEAVDPAPQHEGRLMSLIEQLCGDVQRLQKRYDAELSHRRRVEHALLESEAFYQSLVETLPLALFRKDLEGRLVFANQLVCETFRRPASEILGKTDVDLFPKELAAKYRADDRRVMQTRQTLETTEEFRTPAGEQRYTHVVKTPVYDAQGRMIGIQGVFSDVTDQVQAEMALERERFLLDSLMRSIPDNIYFKDAQGRYLRINPAKAQASGLCDPADALGKTDFDFFSPEHAQRAVADEQSVMQQGRPLIGKEERISFADGTVRWMSTTKLPLKDPNGEIIGTFGVSRDITAIKQAQAALEAAAQAAEQANRAKSDFLANMSHEIRTPLNAVLGMTELVLETPLTPIQRDYLRLVYESGDTLLDLINDILDFSKIEAGKMQLEAVTFELREFVGDALKTLGLRAHRKQLELAFQVDDDVPDVLVGDAHRLRQIVMNLIGNGIKFTDAGEVLLTVSREPAAVPLPSPDRNGRGTEGTPLYVASAQHLTTDLSHDADARDDVIWLHFAVSDTGIGIPPEKFADIFEAFEQADRSTTRRYGGTGLGLAICARLVTLMDGRLWVESEVGRGSTFHFTLPFALGATAQLPPSRLPPELLLGLRVLVVDDNSTNRRILAEMLASWGMSPVLAENVAEAQQRLAAAAAQQQPFGLVLTDVNMPGESGFDLVRSLQSHADLCRGVIVMLTSSDRSDDLSLCQQLGVSTYLIKPVKQSELFDAILQALGTEHATRWQDKSMARARTAARPCRILLAEDSLINQKLAVGLLERWGHTVVVADNGMIAVALASAESFDLILMDIQMPELDGLAATASIRQIEQPTGRHTPIIAMTAHALSGDRERCLAAGMDDYLTKPIRAEQLFQTVERWAQPDAVESSPRDITATSTTTAAISTPVTAGSDIPTRGEGTPSTSAAESLTVSNNAATDANNAGESAINPSTAASETMAHPHPYPHVVAPFIHWSQALERTAGDPELLNAVVEGFCEEAPRVWSALQQALREGETAVARRSAHTLKSSFGTFGVQAGQQLAAGLEQLLRDPGGVPDPSDLRRLEELVQQTLAECDRHLHPNGTPATIPE